jgi:recombination protein RecT
VSRNAIATICNPQLTPELARRAQQNPGSLMTALLEAASNGLKPGTQEYHLTPRGGKDPGVLGIIGWQGEVELIYRAGAVSSVQAEVIYSGDTFVFQPGDERPRHVVDWFAEDRGHVIGAYAYAIMKDGATSRVCVAGPREIKRARAASATADKAFSPWNTDYPAMVRKTAVHMLADWVPTSAEYRVEQLRAVATVQAEQGHATPTPMPMPVHHVTPPPGVDAETGEH